MSTRRRSTSRATPRRRDRPQLSIPPGGVDPRGAGGRTPGAITAEAPVTVELRNYRKDGSLFWNRVTISLIEDATGEVTHFLGFQEDITDTRLTQQVVTVLNRTLRHNLRTSLNVIEGDTELLETNLSQADREGALRTIRERTTALQRISDRTSALQNILAGSDEGVAMPITALEELVDQCRQQYPEAVFETTIPETHSEIPNRSVFRIVVEEAIENAVLHADREPPHVELAADPSDGGDTGTIEITDSGPGIRDSEWTIIKQGNETPLNHADSIGLWLLYWSITALGGSVDRSANQPRGTVLSLQVPTTPGSTQ